ncbi:MAG: Gfo/Idh/MocA family oxidoreductase [Planctomycetota bacterium]|nr:MAG: Gfo/Idh/MocA family oxidoreductase [Planctomycetota bacterium]
MSTNVTRRQFIGTSGKAAAGIAAGLTVNTMLRDAKAAEANEKFNVALIGCGGMGTNNLRFIMDTDQVNGVAVCDVDDSQSAKAANAVEKKQGKKPRVTREYREILDMKDVDLVIIGTPDHWHAAPMMNACAAEKDIYCEKPCSHNIREGRLMVQAAEKYKRVVQVGTYQRSMAHIQEARDFIRSGKLGKICMTQTFTYGNESPVGMGNNPDEPVPAGVDYEKWLGPAPVRPFNRTSSPRDPTFLAGVMGASSFTMPSVSRVSSAGITASAPSGTGAPVMIRTAWPRFRWPA